MDWGGPAKWCFSSWISAAAEKLFHLSRVTYKVIMAQFDFSPKLDGSLQIAKFCVIIFCGSIATRFQHSHCQSHSILRCARMPVSMPELIRRLKPCQKMSPRSWLGTDPDSTCMMCRRLIRLWMNHFIVDIVEDQHAWCVGMCRDVDSCLFVSKHSHDDSEKIQRGTPQKCLVVSDLVAQICPCLRGAKMRCCNRWPSRFAGSPLIWGSTPGGHILFQAGFFQKMKYTSKSKWNIVWTCCNRENHVEAVALPYGNQTQHLKIHHL